MRISDGRNDAWLAKQRRYWNGVADGYDEFYRNGWSAREDDLVAGHLEFLREIGNPQILDAGCGLGLGYALCRRVVDRFTYTGIDIADVMVEQCLRKCPRCTFHHVDMADLAPFDDGRFDAVISLFGPLSFGYDPAAAVAELMRVTRPGGRIYLSVLHRWAFRRVMRLRFHGTEAYRTRGANGRAFAPTRVFGAGELRGIVNRAGGSVDAIWLDGTLAGVFEHERAWPISRYADRVLPTGHMLSMLATRQ